MTNLIAIDPGYAKDSAGCAVAGFLNGSLAGCRFQRPTCFKDFEFTLALGLDHVIVEKPQQDERTRNIPPEVLAHLSWDGALLAGLYAGYNCCDVIALTPIDWKGSASKPVQHLQLWKVLSAQERAILGGEATYQVIEGACEKGALERWKRPGAAYYPRKWTFHNILDAVALGCVYLGRLKK